jgi:hypothetical protein
MAYIYPAPGGLERFDKYRCAEADGEGTRCQLVIGHNGQHVLQRNGRRLAWPVGAEPQIRPPWAFTFAQVAVST